MQHDDILRRTSSILYDKIEGELNISQITGEVRSRLDEIINQAAYSNLFANAVEKLAQELDMEEGELLERAGNALAEKFASQIEREPQIVEIRGSIEERLKYITESADAGKVRFDNEVREVFQEIEEIKQISESYKEHKAIFDQDRSDLDAIDQNIEELEKTLNEIKAYNAENDGIWPRFMSAISLTDGWVLLNTALSIFAIALVIFSNKIKNWLRKMGSTK